MPYYRDPNTKVEKRDIKPKRIMYEWSHPTSGVKPMELMAEIWSDKYRLDVGMTDEERVFRRQWLKDQILAEDEPMNIKGWNEARWNPIRRVTRAPGDWFVEKVTPYVNETRAWKLRMFTKTTLGLFSAFVVMIYYGHHNHGKTWDHGKGAYRLEMKPCYLPGDPEYSQVIRYDKKWYSDLGFNKVYTTFPNIRQPDAMRECDKRPYAPQ